MEKYLAIRKLDRLEQSSLPFALYLFNAHQSSRPEGLLLDKLENQYFIKSHQQLKLLLKQIPGFQKKGFYLACALNYEAGYGFEKKLTLLKSRNTPLGWLGLFTQATVIPYHQLLMWLRQKGGITDYWLPPLIAGINYRDYEKNMKKIKDYIAGGDTYQVNYTFPLTGSYYGNYFSLFRDFYINQPVGYSGLIRNKKQILISLSPELFFSKKGRQIITKPMKGTAARAKSKEKDRQIKIDLSKSQKNKAENIMIVDMLRNDLGRLCRTGSINVDKLFQIEKYKTVFQMTSTVSGQLKPEVTWQEIFSSLFPSGSVTGAPKMRTMQIINELETGARKIYTGALGYIKPNDNAQFNVPIRTIEIKNSSQLICGIGSGVVIDSQVKSEWQECHDKSKFMVNLVREYQLVETMKWIAGRGIPLLNKHLRRIKSSAAFFHMPFNRETIIKELKSTLLKIQSQAARRVRLLLDRNGNVKIQTTPIKEAITKQIPIIMLANQKVSSSNIFLYHKTTNREFYNQLFKKAANKKIMDYIFTNEKDHITEGTISNLFIVKNNQWLTPPVADGLLPGIMRQEVISKYKAIEKSLIKNDLLSADDVYLCNGVRGLVKVQFRSR